MPARTLRQSIAVPESVDRAMEKFQGTGALKKSRFVTPNDFWCAVALYGLVFTVWAFLAGLSVFEFAQSLEAPNYTLDTNKRISLPPMCLDICEDRVATQDSTRYAKPSVLDSFEVKSYLHANGRLSESRIMASADAPRYTLPIGWECLRFCKNTSGTGGDMGSSKELLVWLHFLQDTPEARLEHLHTGDSLVKGLLIRPSLAADPTNVYAYSREPFPERWLIQGRSNKTQAIVVEAKAERHIWSDTFGGRRGAPCDDTFLADVTAFPPGSTSIRQKFDAGVHENSFNVLIAFNILLAETRVVEHVNCLGTDILVFAKALLSYSVVFSLVGWLFRPTPVLRRRFLARIPFIGVGEKVSDDIEMSDRAAFTRP